MDNTTSRTSIRTARRNNKKNYNIIENGEKNENSLMKPNMNNNNIHILSCYGISVGLGIH
eukprot:2731421-Amphidinium_carterae.2